MSQNSNEADLKRDRRALKALIERRKRRIGELRMEKDNAEWKLREVERKIAEYAPTHISTTPARPRASVQEGKDNG